MKKLLIGCLILLVLGGMVAAVGSYFLYRAASGVVENARNYFEGLSELRELDDRVVNRSPHVPPANGELTEDQVQRFVRVQDSVRAALGDRVEEIEQKYKHLKVNSESNRQPSVTEMMSALRDLASLFVEARRFQVNALNQERFSQNEYSWVRDQIFQAAGVHVASKIDLRKLAESVRENTGIEDIRAPELPESKVPEKNRELVKPHLDKMDQWIPLVFFGL